jgi:DNA-binding transcriptional LysR family regulator
MSNVHLRSVDLNLMPVFAAVYEHSSVAAAAAALGMTQPAVSHALRRLRDALGDELFLRRGRRMKPTPKAEKLIPLVRDGLEQLTRVVAAPRGFDPARERTFRAAMPDYVEWVLAARILDRVRREAPLARIHIRRTEALFLPPEEELLRGQMDVALGFFPDLRGLGSSLFQQEVWRERNVLVARRGHPAFRKPITLERFAELPQAAVIYGLDARGFIDREMAARGLPRKLALATPSFLCALRAVAESDLVACLPEGLVRHFPAARSLRTCPAPLPLPEFVLRLVWPRAANEDVDQVWFRQAVLTAAQ